MITEHDLLRIAELYEFAREDCPVCAMARPGQNTMRCGMCSGRGWLVKADTVEVAWFGILEIRKKKSGKILAILSSNNPVEEVMEELLNV